jgi:hypothetical protein
MIWTIDDRTTLPERHLPRMTIAQEDICPNHICRERHLPRNTIAQITIAPTIINQNYIYQKYNLLYEKLRHQQLNC